MIEYLKKYEKLYYKLQRSGSDMTIFRKMKYMDEKCWAEGKHGCKALKIPHEDCGSYKCPFYKPEGCEDWIRSEIDGEQVLKIPKSYEPEKLEKPKQDYWRF